MLLHVSVCDRPYVHAVLWQHTVTPLHVHNDLFLPNFLTAVALARFKYELPDEGHRPKHVAAF